ncbi:MAG: YadA-like family protein, partial [Megasphaera elsdenii]|nr:YadA-like family protein [Megasphaera elsdenii]
ALKANVDASNIGKNLKESDGITPAMEEEQKANLNQWGEAIGTGSIASDNGQLVTGKTVYEYNKPVVAEGKTLNYVSDTNTTGQNLGSLDAQVGTNTGDISNLKNLSNISSAGETVIKNLAKGSIGMENGSHTTVSHRDANGVETYKVDVNVDGKVESGNKGIVDGGAVYSAIQDVKNQTSADLANKANVDASNLTPNNVTKWQEKLGNGKVESGNTGLVTGDTVFKAVDTKANRDGSNLTDKEADSFSEKIARGEVKAGENRAVSGDAVSQAISKVTGDMNTKLDGKANTSLDNITKDGQTVIKKLSQDAVQVKAGDDHITVDAKTDETTGNKTYTISAKDGKVASGDTGLISGGTLYNEVHVDKDGSYIKSGNTVGNNLSALDTGLKNTSSLIHTNTSGDTIHIGETSKATKVDVSSTDANGNKNGRVVTGVVTDAKDANSAANVGYVNGVTAANTQQIYRDMNNAYSRLDTNINRAAAGSNALAALHPLDFDPADKASFAIGYGHYRNANAAAVGAFYQPNANTMVNMGISLGNGDPGFNAGVSFKIGKGSAYNGVSKAEMAQTIHDQATEISAIKADDAAKDKRIDALEKENQEMKKQIQEILARLNG